MPGLALSGSSGAPQALFSLATYRAREDEGKEVDVMTTAASVDPAAELVRKRYNRVARFYDLEQALGERLLFERLRRQLWERVPRQATVLEVGVGTGINMRHYPPDARITAID